MIQDSNLAFRIEYQQLRRQVYQRKRSLSEDKITSGEKLLSWKPAARVILDPSHDTTAGYNGSLAACVQERVGVQNVVLYSRPEFEPCIDKTALALRHLPYEVCAVVPGNESNISLSYELLQKCNQRGRIRSIVRIKRVNFADEKDLPLCNIKDVKTYYRMPKNPVPYALSTTRRSLNVQEVESECSGALTDEDSSDDEEEDVPSPVQNRVSHHSNCVYRGGESDRSVLIVHSELHLRRVFGWIKYWKHVYCELHWAGVLTIFSSRISFSARDVIVVSKYKAHIVDHENFIFQLRIHGRILEFQCQSKQKMHDWVCGINTKFVLPQEPIETWIQSLRAAPPVHFVELKRSSMYSHGYRTSYCGAKIPRTPNPCLNNNHPLLGGRRQTNHLIFVRHGQSTNMQFRTDDCEKHLTYRGEQQSIFTGSFLKAFLKARQVQLVDDSVSIFHSGLSRAAQTARVIHRHLSPSTVHMFTTNLVCEGVPDLPVEDRNCHRISRLKMAYQLLCLPQIRWEQSNSGKSIPLDCITREKQQEAFQQVFDPEETDERYGDRYRIVVCHAQVIHYFICRALEMDEDHLHGAMTINHCSITQLSISPDGHVTLHGVNQSAHLPPNLQTQK